VLTKHNNILGDTKLNTQMYTLLFFSLLKLYLFNSMA